MDSVLAPQSNAVGGESSDSYRIRTRSQRSNVLPPLPGSGSSSATPSGTAVLTTSRRTKLSKSQGDDSSKTSEESRRAASESATEKQPDLKKDLELQPLFYRTSKNGYYTPIPGSNSSTRLNAFRNVGRWVHMFDFMYVGDSHRMCITKMRVIGTRKLND